MGNNQVYSEKELLNLYLKKINELGKMPRKSEIDGDPELPAYSTFCRRLGDMNNILEKLGVKTDPAQYKKQLCLDCIYDPRKCGREYEECKKEAKLYFKMLEKKT